MKKIRSKTSTRLKKVAKYLAFGAGSALILEDLISEPVFERPSLLSRGWQGMNSLYRSYRRPNERSNDVPEYELVASHEHLDVPLQVPQPLSRGQGLLMTSLSRTFPAIKRGFRFLQNKFDSLYITSGSEIDEAVNWITIIRHTRIRNRLNDELTRSVAHLRNAGYEEAINPDVMETLTQEIYQYLRPRPFHYNEDNRVFLRAVNMIRNHYQNLPRLHRYFEFNRDVDRNFLPLDAIFFRDKLFQYFVEYVQSTHPQITTQFISDLRAHYQNYHRATNILTRYWSNMIETILNNPCESLLMFLCSCFMIGVGSLGILLLTAVAFLIILRILNIPIPNLKKKKKDSQLLRIS